jgi:hypothetical protein
VVVWLGAVERDLAAIQLDYGATQLRLDNMDRRIERIERRLSLIEARVFDPVRRRATLRSSRRSYIVTLAHYGGPHAP